MATEAIRLSAFFPVSPERLYRAWLDGLEHSKMTGGVATVDQRVGGRHTAWDGYIEGEILELDPTRRFVQTWRSTDFPADSAPSRLEVELVPEGVGTRVELLHSEIPEGQGTMYRSGWYDNYFTPMRSYFQGAGSAAGESKPIGAEEVDDIWDDIPETEPGQPPPPIVEPTSEKAPARRAKRPAVKKESATPAKARRAKAKPAKAKRAKAKRAKKPAKATRSAQPKRAAAKKRSKAKAATKASKRGAPPKRRKATTKPRSGTATARGKKAGGRRKR
jgi:uncharacterized protein YndB with AHSA1/START domain